MKIARSCHISVCIRPSVTSGRVTAPPSKSVSHRMLIGAALADGVSEWSGLSFSEDVAATMDVLADMGARFEVLARSEGTDGGETVRVHGCGGRISSGGAPLFCRESGSTLRFILPLCLLSPQGRTLTGSARLFSRPLGVYERLFAARWGEQTVNEQDPVSGGMLRLTQGTPIEGGKYQLSGGVSSQFVSGLLFALPLCERDSELLMDAPPESRPYIDLTLQALRAYGVQARWQDAQTILVSGGQRYLPRDGRIEGDASNAAFFAALNFVGGAVTVDGLAADSLQGDRVFGALFDRLAAARGDGEEPRIDLADCPDLAPILFTLAAEHGGALFTHTDRLRLKECDRIAAMQQELAKFGARIEAFDSDSSSTAATCGGMVRVLPTRLHAPTEPLDGHNDHRVVMSLAVLATKYGGVIRGAEAVRKSLPDFFDRLASLGADVSVEA